MTTIPSPATFPIRVLFCIGITQTFFDLPTAGQAEVFAGFAAAFGDLEGRFGLKLLGTLDDDRIQVGQSVGHPFTSYILAEVPDLETIVKVCDQLRQTPVGDYRLWRYARIETRIGRPAFTESPHG
ncbi:hypothetical protein [Rhizorhabdus wittichii]|uniref:Uncharacterized protein n=2 Tax=Rhizorhabdus wittichii TaxID=160791 RepID=A0A9J9HF08_RHIWR|nr:hypothetical protein [Rhizorhabdus wittichii]ABQ70525.1 hypothetical protein Swit_4185 [Rhizorhabdus wittichii RW1]QTH23947.1 hypothetical protein HRJ34_10805 [Rhizorhabdus wittichii]